MYAKTKMQNKTILVGLLSGRMTENCKQKNTILVKKYT